MLHYKKRRKIGYLVFNSFLGDTTEINNEFNRVFNKFSSQNIADVVIDLRYNGGGYVSLQSKLANYLINSSANNNLMMKEQFNDKNTSKNSTTYYRKAGSLNLNKIFFIVTNGLLFCCHFFLLQRIRFNCFIIDVKGH